MNIRKLKDSPETMWLIGTLRVKLFWYTKSSLVIIKRCNINTFTLYVNNWGVTAINMDYTYLLFFPNIYKCVCFPIPVSAQMHSCVNLFVCYLFILMNTSLTSLTYHLDQGKELGHEPPCLRVDPNQLERLECWIQRQEPILHFSLLLKLPTDPQVTVHAPHRAHFCPLCW